MKKVLGLDIGVSSVGWALIHEDGQQDDRQADIIKMGVRIVNEDPNFHGKFYQGNSASKNADRRTKRMIRRLNNRYKARRDNLVEELENNGMLPSDELMYGKTALELYELRAKALHEKVSLEELGRIFYHLNQKRGFLSNRKSQSEEESNSDYLARINELHKAVEKQTIGEYFYKILSANPKARIKQNIFPRADYIKEFDLIWKKQQAYYPETLTGKPGEFSPDSLYNRIRNEIIYFQRPLKSQKHLVSKCRFEPRKKVVPKSSPLFQVFRIRQQLNNLSLKEPDNTIWIPDDVNKEDIFEALYNKGGKLDRNNNLSASSIKKLLEVPKNWELNFKELEGNKTYITLLNALTEAGISDPEQHLAFDPTDKEYESKGLYLLWHITYSLPAEQEVIKTLMKHFPFTEEQATIIAKKTGYTSDYGSLSARAIRKIMPGLLTGLHYDKACKDAGYENFNDPFRYDPEALQDKMDPILPNELRNPVVEQILNQVVNLVNGIIEEYGKPDEVRVEMARELRSNAKKRKRIEQENRKLRKLNEGIAARLLKEYGFKRVNGRDIQRYRLWEETEYKCLYCGNQISFTELYNGTTEIEHILPRSRSFSNASSNFIIAHTSCNKEKNQATAMDYLKQKSDAAYNRFVEDVNRLYNEKKINGAKRNNLLCAGDEIPDDFIDRQKNDTQYIAKETVIRLKDVFPTVRTTSGTVTDYLREHWQLNHILKEINLPKYREIGQTGMRTIKDEQGNDKTFEDIINWTKREDHRHHAVDALIIALTNDSIIFRLNNLNKLYERYKDLKESAYYFKCPVDGFRRKVRQELETMLISFKKPNSKVLSKKVNKVRTSNGTIEQITWAPRGSLHEDTVFGQIRRYAKVKLDKKFDRLADIVDDGLRQKIAERLERYDHNTKAAFQNLTGDPILWKGRPINEVTVWETAFTKRVALSENLTPAQVEKIVDARIKELVKERIADSGGIKKAFKEYAEDPIYLDEGRKIPIKSVTVLDNSSLAGVRDGFVATKGNHHAIIYTDGNGNFREKIVSFWEAVEQCRRNLAENGTIYPLIDTTPPEEGWQVHCTLQINDLFLIGINPADVDWDNPTDRKAVSDSLFRLQKMSESYYVFRHQFESTIQRETDFSFKRIVTLKRFENIYPYPINQSGKLMKHY